MYFRLVAIPRSWVDVDLFILEDTTGSLYQYEPERDHLERLADRDANLLMQWYELSQTFTWHARDALQELLGSPTRRPKVPATAPGTESMTTGAW